MSGIIISGDIAVVPNAFMSGPRQLLSIVLSLILSLGSFSASSAFPGRGLEAIAVLSHTGVLVRR